MFVEDYASAVQRTSVNQSQVGTQVHQENNLNGLSRCDGFGNDNKGR